MVLQSMQKAGSPYASMYTSAAMVQSSTFYQSCYTSFSAAAPASPTEADFNTATASLQFHSVKPTKL